MAPPRAFAARKQHALKDRIVITAAGFVAIPPGKAALMMASARLATVSIQPAVSIQHVALEAAVRRELALKMMARLVVPALTVRVSRAPVPGPTAPAIALATPSFVVQAPAQTALVMPVAHAFAPMAPVLVIRPAKSIRAIVAVYPIVRAKFVVKMVAAKRPVGLVALQQPATKTVV
jgi:hypothetical protein